MPFHESMSSLATGRFLGFRSKHHSTVCSPSLQSLFISPCLAPPSTHGSFDFIISGKFSGLASAGKALRFSRASSSNAMTPSAQISGVKSVSMLCVLLIFSASSTSGAVYSEVTESVHTSPAVQTNHNHQRYAVVCQECVAIWGHTGFITCAS
jgi:hypothetical protein